MIEIPGSGKFNTTPKNSKVLSCIRCRRQKRKCSRERPICQYCSVHGHECSYGNARLPKEQVEHGTRQRKQSNDSSVSSGSSVSSSVFSKIDKISIDKLTEPNIEEKTETDIRTERDIRTFTIKPKLCGPKTPITSCDEAISPAGKSFWPRQPLINDTDLTPSSRIGPVITNIFNSSLNKTGTSLQENLDTLSSYMPEKKLADSLFYKYKSSIHPIIPILDWNLMCPLYESFWNDSKTADLSFFIQMFSIFYSASVAEYEEISFRNQSNDEIYVARMKFFVGATEIALAMADFPKNISLVGLQASVLLHSVIRNDCKTDDCGSVGTLVRLAQLIELNRDPIKYLGITDEREIQMRRLLWWQIYHLDTTIALSSRIPPIIMENEYDTLLPNEYYGPCTGDYKLLDQAIAFANSKYKWVEVCNKILRQSFKLAPISLQDINNLQSRINDLTSFCSFQIDQVLNPSYIMPSHEVFVKFSSSVISTLPDRCQILLNIIIENRPHQRMDLSSVSKDELTSNPKLIEYQIHLLTEYIRHGKMPEFVGFLWEIRKFQPIQTILSLLRSLIADLKQIYSVNKSIIYIKSFQNDKKVKCINDTFTNLLYLSEHTTQLCKDRWQLLKDLRRSIWEFIYGDSEFDRPVEFVPTTPSDEVMSVHDIKLSDEVDDTYWNDLGLELDGFNQVIDDNINIKLWDQDSGHYLV